jgi:hypothetical protein
MVIIISNKVIIIFNIDIILYVCTVYRRLLLKGIEDRRSAYFERIMIGMYCMT